MELMLITPIYIGGHFAGHLGAMTAILDFLKYPYLSQIKSDLHEILRVSDGDPSATKWGPEGPPFGG